MKIKWIIDLCSAPQVLRKNAKGWATRPAQITTAGYSYDAGGNMTKDGYNTLIYDGEMTCSPKTAQK